MEETDPENELVDEEGEGIGVPAEEIELDEDLVNQLRESGMPVIWTNHDDFQVFSASSVYGGIQPEGNFQMTFLLDSFADPGLKEEHIGGHNRVISDIGIRVRQRQTSVTVTPQQALSIGSWILSHVTDADQDDIVETISEKFAVTFGGQSSMVGPLLKESDLDEKEREKVESLMTSNEGRAQFQDTLKDAAVQFLSEWEGDKDE